MYNVSSAFLTKIKEASRTVKASIGIGNKSLINMLTNSGFSNGVTGWSLSGAVTTVSNGIATTNATVQYHGMSQSFTPATNYANHKLYVGVYFKADTPNAVRMHFYDGVTYTGIISHRGDNTWQYVSNITTMGATPTQCSLTIQDYRLSGFTPFYTDNAIVIDLTAMFGAGNEPTQSEMDELISKVGWFDGTKNVPSTILDSSIISKFSIESSFGSGDMPTIGSTVSNKLNLTFINNNRLPQVLVNTPIRPYVAIDLGSGVYEWVEMGEFYADSSDVVKGKLETSLEAFDKMASYDQYKYETTLVLPKNVSDIISDLKTRYGVTFASQPSLPNTALSSIPTGTVRQVISQLAGLMTTNATIDENGDVKFIFLVSSGFSMDTANYSNFKLTSDAQVKLSQLQVKIGEELIVVGDDSGYALKFENAQIIDSTILTTVYNRAFSSYLYYYAYTMTSQGMPHLQIGDTISFTYLKLDGSTSTITIPILNHKFSFNGGMSSEFKADAPKQEVTDITVNSGSTVGDAIKQSHADLMVAIDNATKLITGNKGGEVMTILDPNTGKPTDLVICDTGNINTATNVWRWNSSGLGYSSDGFGGHYDTAITSDGHIVAEFISGGTITGALIKTSSTTNYMHLKEQNIDIYNNGILKLSIGFIDAGGFEFFPQLIMYNNDGDKKVVGAIMGGGSLASGIESIENDLTVYGKLYGASIETNGTVHAHDAIDGSRFVGMTPSGNEFYQCGVETRGSGSDNAIYPAIGFHQPTRFAGTIEMRDEGQFYFLKQGANFGDVHFNNLYANASGCIKELAIGDNTINDRQDGSPWYGIGRMSWAFDSLGGTPVQVAGYWGVRLRSSNACIDIHQSYISTSGDVWFGGIQYGDRLAGVSNVERISYGSGNCRQDVTNGTYRLFTSPNGSADTGVTFDGNSFTYKVNSTTKFNVSSTGTKTGGFIELDGMNVGLSPVDSPRVLHQDILSDVMVEESGTTIFLDELFAKTMDGYAVFPNNGQVIISDKTPNSFKVTGFTGIVDFNIIGNRRDMTHQYFDIQ